MHRLGTHGCTGAQSSLGVPPFRGALLRPGPHSRSRAACCRTTSSAAPPRGWPDCSAARAPQDGAPLTAVFAYRSPVAFTGVLAALLRGHGYVPLNRTFPPARTAVDAAALRGRGGGRRRRLTPAARRGAGLARAPMLVVLADQDDVDAERARWPNHEFASRRDVDETPEAEPVASTPARSRTCSSPRAAPASRRA